MYSGEAIENADGAAREDERAEPLVRRLDDLEFRGIYEQTAPRLHAFLRRAAPQAADDLLQETYYRFLRARAPEMDEAQTRAYLYRIAGALLADRWRRARSAWRWRVLNVFRGGESPDPDTRHDVRRIFAGLKPREQQLLWLAYVEGAQHREIAAALGLQEKSIKGLLFRARQRLAGILAKGGWPIPRNTAASREIEP